MLKLVNETRSHVNKYRYFFVNDGIKLPFCIACTFVVVKWIFEDRFRVAREEMTSCTASSVFITNSEEILKPK